MKNFLRTLPSEAPTHPPPNKKRNFRNIEKSVVFHPTQRKLTSNLHLTLDGKELKQELYIKCLGVFIDSNFRWKHQIAHVATKIKRSIGILFKPRHYINTD